MNELCVRGWSMCHDKSWFLTNLKTWYELQNAYNLVFKGAASVMEYMKIDNVFFFSFIRHI